MPSAAPRPCAGGCGTLVPRGRCPSCAKLVAPRATATFRGYDAAWRAFRLRFVNALVEAGIAPVCGAALPDGPKTSDSACAALGVWEFSSQGGSSLHVDHEPKLEEHERRDVRAVCDLRRVQLLCQSCHSVKTSKEEARCSRSS